MGCEWYAQDDRCTQFGNTYANTEYDILGYQVPANIGCCACGGGQNGYSTSTETSTTSSYCEDWRPEGEEQWVAQTGPHQGSGCSEYAFFCVSDSARQRDQGFGRTAGEACCRCGGGVGFTTTESLTSSTTHTNTTTTATGTTGTTSSATTGSNTTGSMSSTISQTTFSNMAVQPLKHPVTAGATNITLVDESAFEVGETIRIADPQKSETRLITAMGTLVLQAPLLNDYDPSNTLVSIAISITATSSTTATATTITGTSSTSTTMTPCADMLPSAQYLPATMWTDSNGMTCDFYADYSQSPSTATNINVCEKFGASYKNMGMVANEACCACGGGSNGVSTITSTTTSTTICVDYRPEGADEWRVDRAVVVGSAPTGVNILDSTCSFMAFFCDPAVAPFMGLSEAFDGTTAMRACCACGGGTGLTSTSSFSSTTSTTESHTTTSATSTGCADAAPNKYNNSAYPYVGFWTDANGFGCDHYAQYDLCRDSGTNPAFERFDKTASEACCTCGGGMNFEVVAPTSTETSTTTTACLDITPLGVPKWTDSNGNDCIWYAYFCGTAGFQDGDLFPNFNLTANEVCCSCGGGVGYTETNTSTVTTSSSITTTVTECTDYVPSILHPTQYPNVKKWHDDRGPEYDCQFYVENGLCGLESTQVGVKQFGRNANQACCACGGGMQGTSTFTETSTITTSTTSSACRDVAPFNGSVTLPEWYDSRGPSYNCNWYRFFCASSTQYPNFGLTADRACCACGGGVGLTATSTTSASTSSSTLTTTTPCVDIVPVGQAAWHDSLGAAFDCAWYAASSERCPILGTLFPNFNTSALEACCDCGGGVGRPLAPVTFTATTTTIFAQCYDGVNDPTSPTGFTDGLDQWEGVGGCAFFAHYPSWYCANFSALVSDQGRTPGEACCVCNGGITATATTSTTTFCQDWAPHMDVLWQPSWWNISRWHDALGEEFDCDWYADSRSSPKQHSHCEHGNDDNLRNWGKTPSEACCVCGGGVSSTATPTSTTTTVFYEPCTDVVLEDGSPWRDVHGDSCAWYAHDTNCDLYGDMYANHGYTAKTACCACGRSITKTFTTTTFTAQWIHTVYHLTGLASSVQLSQARQTLHEQIAGLILVPLSNCHVSVQQHPNLPTMIMCIVEVYVLKSENAEQMKLQLGSTEFKNQLQASLASLNIYNVHQALSPSDGRYDQDLWPTLSPTPAPVTYTTGTTTGTTATVSTSTLTHTGSTTTTSYTLTAPTTSLQFAHEAGSATLYVTSTGGFQIGDHVHITGGGNAEFKTITGVGSRRSSAGSFSLDEPLRHSYPASTTVHVATTTVTTSTTTSSTSTTTSSTRTTSTSTATMSAVVVAVPQQTVTEAGTDTVLIIVLVAVGVLALWTCTVVVLKVAYVRGSAEKADVPDHEVRPTQTSKRRQGNIPPVPGERRGPGSVPYNVQFDVDADL